MIESGLTLLVNADSAVKAIAPIGGFLAELPKDQALPSWSYFWASDTPHYTFEGLRPVNQRRLQIDCYGAAAEVINLAQAIDNVLSGFNGTLTDVDATIVASISVSVPLKPLSTLSIAWARLITSAAAP